MSIPILPQELQGLVDGVRKPVVVDARTAEEYAARHIPLARNVDSTGLAPRSTTMEGMTSFHSDVAEAFRVLGNFEKVELVVYAGDCGPRACRALWIMHYAGQLGARLLVGGFRAWAEAGLPVTQEVPESDPTHFPVRSRRELFAGIEEVREAARDGRALLLDVRSEEEVAGGGTIPGAASFDAVRFLATDASSFVSAEDLGPALEAAGITRERVLILFSNAAGRSSVAWTGLRILGYRRVKNFLGGFREWKAASHRD